MLDAVKGTPTWVWIVFLLLIVRSFQDFKTKTIFFPKILILPAVLIFVSITGIFPKYELNIFTVASYVIALLFGILARWFLANKQKLEIDKAQQTITVKGTTSALVLIFAIFTIKYIFGYIDSVDPELAKSNMYFVFAEIILSGLVAGLFCGKALNYIYRYLKE